MNKNKNKNHNNEDDGGIPLLQLAASHDTASTSDFESPTSMLDLHFSKTFDEDETTSMCAEDSSTAVVTPTDESFAYQDETVATVWMQQQQQQQQQQEEQVVVVDMGALEAETVALESPELIKDEVEPQDVEVPEIVEEDEPIVVDATEASQDVEVLDMEDLESAVESTAPLMEIPEMVDLENPELIEDKVEPQDVEVPEIEDEPIVVDATEAPQDVEVLDMEDLLESDVDSTAPLMEISEMVDLESPDLIEDEAEPQDVEVPEIEDEPIVVESDVDSTAPLMEISEMVDLESPDLIEDEAEPQDVEVPEIEDEPIVVDATEASRDVEALDMEDLESDVDSAAPLMEISEMEKVLDVEYAKEPHDVEVPEKEDLLLESPELIVDCTPTASTDDLELGTPSSATSLFGGGWGSDNSEYTESSEGHADSNDKSDIWRRDTREVFSRSTDNDLELRITFTPSFDIGSFDLEEQCLAAVPPPTSPRRRRSRGDPLLRLWRLLAISLVVVFLSGRSADVLNRFQIPAKIAGAYKATTVKPTARKIEVRDPFLDVSPIVGAYNKAATVKPTARRTEVRDPFLDVRQNSMGVWLN
jgi:hypothetical protein